MEQVKRVSAAGANLIAARLGEQHKGVRSTAAAGGRFLWVLSFGQAKERTSLVGARPDHRSWSIIPMRHVDSGASTKGFRYGSAVQTVDRLLHLPGHLLVLDYLQDLMLQEHAVQADSGEYVLEFDSNSEYI